jgi:hypothetical protein
MFQQRRSPLARAPPLWPQVHTSHVWLQVDSDDEDDDEDDRASVVTSDDPQQRTRGVRAICATCEELHEDSEHREFISAGASAGLSVRVLCN